MIEIRNLGRMEYGEAWKLQQELLSSRIRGEVGDTLLIVEHDPVVTLGRKTPGLQNVIERGLKEWEGLPLFVVERGGEATYHGPGQVVLYPIFRFSEKLGPRGFLHMLEQSIVDYLASLEIKAFSIEGATGVWLKDEAGRERKIASIGISARSHVSYHGLAFNLAADLGDFRKIKPCGFAPDVMINLVDLLGEQTPDFQSVAFGIADHLCQHFLNYGVSIPSELYSDAISTTLN